MSDDALVAALQPIRDRAGVFAKLGPPRTGDAAVNAAVASAGDVPALVAFADAALKLADDWDAEAKRIGAKFAGEEDPWPRTVAGMRAQAFEQCAKALRESITRELTGQEAPDVC